MSAQPPRMPPDGPVGSGLSVDWIVWPLKESWTRSVAVIFFLAAVVWAISKCFGTMWLLPAAVILFLFLAGFFLPTYYHLDGDIISVRAFLSTKKRNWAGLKEYSVGKKGVHLSLRSTSADLFRDRSIYLPFGEKKEEILEFVAEMMNRGR